jgi:hypothetical protein
MGYPIGGEPPTRRVLCNVKYKEIQMENVTWLPGMSLKLGTYSITWLGYLMGHDRPCF